MPDTAGAMSYQLISLTGSNPHRVVGEYDNYGDALVARGNDVLAQLRDNAGWRMRCEHLIVGPGGQGPEMVHPFCTELGVDPDRGTPPTEHDLDEAHNWLTALHQP
jgi:hypothetical protein